MMMKTKALLITLLSVLTVSLTFAQLPSNVPTLGLQAWYSFNGNTNDLSGNGNHLGNVGAVPAPDRNGTPSQAYSFNGSSNYMVNNTPGFVMSDASPFTVSLWVNKPTTASGVFLMHGSTAGGNFIYIFQAGTNLQFGTNKQQSSWIWIQTTYPTNTWIHLVGVYQNYVMTLYLDGTPVGTNTFSHTSVSSTTLPFYVGKGVSGNYVQASIDDIGVWNRALSQAEITGLFTDCQAVFGDTVNVTACDHYMTPGGNNYTQSGTYPDTLQTSLGCDSIITINLMIKNSSSGSETVTSCFQHVSPSGAYIWTSSGIYSDTVQNAVGCDSVITVNLTINTVDVSVTQVQTTLTANATFASYQWLDCDNAYSSINGATNQSYQPGANGNYAVEVTQNSCTDTSLCYQVTGVGIQESLSDQSWNIFPNPTDGRFRISDAIVGTKFELELYDIQGKLVFREAISMKDANGAIINIEGIEDGMYILHIKSDQTLITRRLLIRN